MEQERHYGLHTTTIRFTINEKVRINTWMLIAAGFFNAVEKIMARFWLAPHRRRSSINQTLKNMNHRRAHEGFLGSLCRRLERSAKMNGAAFFPLFLFFLASAEKKARIIIFNPSVIDDRGSYGRSVERKMDSPSNLYASMLFLHVPAKTHKHTLTGDEKSHKFEINQRFFFSSDDCVEWFKLTLIPFSNHHHINRLSRNKIWIEASR